jgi:hypothetical protein
LYDRTYAVEQLIPKGKKKKTKEILQIAAKTDHGKFYSSGDWFSVHLGCIRENKTDQDFGLSGEEIPLS